MPAEAAVLAPPLVGKRHWWVEPVAILHRWRRTRRQGVQGTRAARRATSVGVHQVGTDAVEPGVSAAASEVKARSPRCTGLAVTPTSLRATRELKSTDTLDTRRLIVRADNAAARRPDERPSGRAAAHAGR